jgi:hypothetical protein
MRTQARSMGRSPIVKRTSRTKWRETGEKLVKAQTIDVVAYITRVTALRIFVAIQIGKF